jgi:hypothetical protein
MMEVQGRIVEITAGKGFEPSFQVIVELAIDDMPPFAMHIPVNVITAAEASEAARIKLAAMCDAIANEFLAPGSLA